MSLTPLELRGVGYWRGSFGVRRGNCRNPRTCTPSPYSASPHSGKCDRLTAGQIQSEMALKESLPAVCAALGSSRFESAYRVKVRPVPIPLNSSTTEFTIEV